MKNQEKLNKIASVHLGKAGDGTTVKPYVTPDTVDSNLLVGVPRYLNREIYDLEEENLPFEGVDAWNAYEFSTLLENGFPVSLWLKFTYSSDTPNIVESKSAKLYLNSYNMARLIRSRSEIYLIEDKISIDLSKVIGGNVDVSLASDNIDLTKPIIGDFISLENYCDVERMIFDQYNESPDILEIIPSTRYYDKWRSNSLRSNCRITNQPDWGDVFIYIKGDKTVTPESLLKYIISMRKESHFHEEITECIYKRLFTLLEPQELLVSCLYTRRGGIDINPIRVSDSSLLSMAPIAFVENFCIKTLKQ